MSRALPPDVLLHQFASSHFNEKVRWALDRKGVPHTRRSHLPGPHAGSLRRLSGQTQTPVLVLDGRVIPGSAAILAALEERFPERPLLPARPEAHRRALRLQEEFDREVGPAVRTAVFSVMIDEPGFLCRTFAGSRAAPTRLLYRALLPVARGRIARANQADEPEAVARAFERTHRALDFVAAESRATGQLVGEDFTLADLACAALLAPLAELSHPDMRRPAPIPAAIGAFLAEWREHPGVAWVRGQYERHRPLPTGA